MTSLLRLLRSSGARHGLVMAVALVVAGGLDYAVNVVAGRRLEPVDFGTFITVNALLQVALMLSTALRTVVAFHTAGLATASADGAVVRFAWRRAWRWGLVASALVAAASPLVARALRLPSVWPVLVASAMPLMLFLRETTLGAVQGMQAFGTFAVSQVVQAALRISLVVALVALGTGAVGAIGAQPLAAVAAVAIALVPLRSHLRARHPRRGPRQGSAQVSGAIGWRYSASTLAGLTAFGLLTNLDALFVKRCFGPAIAGGYGPVVTLGKICLFLPWAVALVLFPKVARRRAAGLDPRPILLLALGATAAPGVAISAACFLRPGAIVTAAFGARYPDPGAVLGLVTLAATLYSGIHVWLSYALSLGRKTFAWLLVGVVAWQTAGMILLGRDSLLHMALVMVSGGLIGNAAGWLATWSAAPSRRVEHGAAVAGSA